MKTIDRDQVRRLLDDGAQVVEVLEEGEYRKVHLPGAINIPGWELTAERAEAELSRERPVVLYCYDNL